MDTLDLNVAVKTEPTWAPATAGGLHILAIQGPDTEGNWASIIRDRQGRVIGLQHTSDGKCIEHDNGDYDLVSAIPRYVVRYATVIIDALGTPVIHSCMDTKFPKANVAFVFESGKLVGLKNY